MPQLSPLEILVVAAVALIVFGPEKLPDIARTVGGAAARMRRMAAEFREEFETSLTVDEDDDFDTDDDEVPRNRPPARGSHRPQGAPRASRPAADPEEDSVPEPFATLHDDATPDAPDDDVVPPTIASGDDGGAHPPETKPER